MSLGNSELFSFSDNKSTKGINKLLQIIVTLDNPKKMKILNQSISFILVAFLMVSCNTGEKKSSENTSTNVDLTEIIKSADAIIPDISSVDDVLITLELAEAKYYPMLCNDPYNASNYLNDKADAAANLGVYVTDIVYQTYGEAIEDVFITFSASQQLANYMGFASEFGATILTELEGGNVSRDSLIFVFNQLMAESKNYNSADEMIYVHTAFITGLYIEKIYITGSLLGQSQKKEDPTENDVINFKKLLVVFNKQLESIDLILSSVDNHEKQLKEIFDINELESVKTSAVKLNEKTSEILKSMELKASPEVSTLNSLITNIRTKIVSAS